MDSSRRTSREDEWRSWTSDDVVTWWPVSRRRLLNKSSSMEFSLAILTLATSWLKKKGPLLSITRLRTFSSSLWTLPLYDSWRTSISASLSAKFRQALPNNIQMYVYRCTLYTTLQNPGWKIKTGYSQSDSDALLLQQFMKEKRARCCPRCARGVLPRQADICNKYI